MWFSVHTSKVLAEPFALPTVKLIKLSISGLKF